MPVPDKSKDASKDESPKKGSTSPKDRTPSPVPSEEEKTPSPKTEKTPKAPELPKLRPKAWFDHALPGFFSREIPEVKPPKEG